MDCIFCTPTLLTNSSKALIHICPWSHHQIVSLDISHIDLAPTPFDWCLNDSLLTDPSITNQISAYILDYFFYNTTEDISPTTLWMAHKAVLRGHIINIASARNKKRLTDIKSLTRDLDQLYNKLNQTPTQDISQQIPLKCQELDTLLCADTERSLRFSKAKLLLNSNSTSTMFTKKLNQTHKPPHVYKLRDRNGSVVSHPHEVLQIFSDFYKNLLSGPQMDPLPESYKWLDGLQLPNLKRPTNNLP